jgi:hypothetical protein
VIFLVQQEFKRVTVLLTEKERKAYDQWCLDHDTTKSKDLKEHILNRIGKAKKKEGEKK